MDGHINGEVHAGIHAYSYDGVQWKTTENPKFAKCETELSDLDHQQLRSIPSCLFF